MKRFEIIRKDITTLPVDAIVNAANKTLLGGGGVDGAIHAKAGPELLDFCRKLGGCRPGQAKASPGFKLPAKFVLHTVGPIWRGGKQGEPELLASCYRTCLEIAAQRHFHSIAFPSISTGAYRYPLRQAADIAVKTILEFLETNRSLHKVYMACLDMTTLHAYLEAHKSLVRGEDV